MQKYGSYHATMTGLIFGTNTKLYEFTIIFHCHIHHGLLLLAAFLAQWQTIQVIWSLDSLG